MNMISAERLVVRMKQARLGHSKESMELRAPLRIIEMLSIRNIVRIGPLSRTARPVAQTKSSITTSAKLRLPPKEITQKLHNNAKKHSS
jgi:hypothetical protein